MILFIRTLIDIEKIYRDVGGYDISYYEFKKLCRKSWVEENNYLCIDKSKKRDQGRYCIYNESKNTYTECTAKTQPF